ncbi:undecaprenyl-diphosphatase [Prauserella shujinwangii]|uniref:Undecaprenyl-diphosphatase n=1 Tax=Prauserella shujinwangii TaxID=1453103 RepID=A0A2T0LL63_9PSEU|nr:phosphatase PAP2 family protein [Prauserella shujinwangii]PRX43700.1 undecaprenyl-diphosphatase [Prauserella shujinwangii]
MTEHRDSGPGLTGATERFAARTAGALVLVVACGLGFALLLALLRLRWAPLRDADRAVADRLNLVVSGNDRLASALDAVTRLGGATVLAWVLTVGVLYLLIRRLPWVALYVSVTAIGGMVLSTLVKTLVDRIRPVVDVPVGTAPGPSFPSGHALGSLVGYGVLFLVFAPAVSRRVRRILAAVVALLVLAIGFTRMALGVHYLTDVLGGWLLGALWLTATTVAFRRWLGDLGARRVSPTATIGPEAAGAVEPAPRDRPPALASPGRQLAALAVAWVLVGGVLLGVGEWLQGAGPGPQAPGWDQAVSRWLVGVRTPALTAVTSFVAKLSDTAGIAAGAMVFGPLAIALSRSWRPMLFLAVALLGEVTLYLVVANAVSRARPHVPDLVTGLPAQQSFPSGHLTAAIALYLGTALLATSATRGWWRWPFVALAVLIPLLVAFQRVYAGAHYLSDVLGSVLLAVPWTLVAWWVLRPGEAFTGEESARRRFSNRRGG